MHNTNEIFLSIIPLEIWKEIFNTLSALDIAALYNTNNKYFRKIIIQMAKKSSLPLDKGKFEQCLFRYIAHELISVVDNKHCFLDKFYQTWERDKVLLSKMLSKTSMILLDLHNIDESKTNKQSIETIKQLVQAIASTKNGDYFKSSWARKYQYFKEGLPYKALNLEQSLYASIMAILIFNLIAYIFLETDHRSPLRYSQYIAVFSTIFFFVWFVSGELSAVLHRGWVEWENKKGLTPYHSYSLSNLLPEHQKLYQIIKHNFYEELCRIKSCQSLKTINDLEKVLFEIPNVLPVKIYLADEVKKMNTKLRLFMDKCEKISQSLTSSKKEKIKFNLLHWFSYLEEKNELLTKFNFFKQQTKEATNENRNYSQNFLNTKFIS